MADEQGVFDPLPAQAVFAHIARACQPPPRIIVISYVCSKVTETHLASLSTWALTSSPPAYVFSPLETRLREKRPLHLALHHAIPMSMYAWPADSSPWGSSPTQSLLHDRRASLSLIKERKTEEAEEATAHSLPAPARKDETHPHRGSVAIASGAQISFDDGSSEEEDTPGSGALIKQSTPGKSGSWNSPEAAAIIPLPGSQERIYPSDPVATLTVITASAPAESHRISQSLSTLPPPHKPPQVLDLPSTASPDRQPPPPAPIQTRLDKEHSVPGHSAQSPGATSTKAPTAFSAMSGQYDRIPLWTLAPGVGALHGPTSVSIGIRLSDFSAINLRDKSTQSVIAGGGQIQNLGAKSFSSVEAGIRTSPIALKGLGLGLDPIKRPDSAVESERRKVPSIHGSSTGEVGGTPDASVPRPQIQVTPPDQKPAAPLPPGSLEAGGRVPSASWPVGVNRVPGWKKGRKELMEDTIEELGKGLMGVDEEMMERVAQMALTPDKAPPPKGRLSNAVWACDWEEGLMSAMT